MMPLFVFDVVMRNGCNHAACLGFERWASSTKYSMQTVGWVSWLFKYTRRALIFTHISQHARLEIPMDLRDPRAFSPPRPA